MSKTWFLVLSGVAANGVGLSVGLVIVDHPRAATISYTTRQTSVSV